MTLESTRARITAGSLAYVDLGDPEAPPVVLLHGFPTSKELWGRDGLLFASRMRVIAPDLLGYGQSDRPAHADFSIGAQAGYVRELLDALGIDRFAVVGHDLGGGVAQLLALEGGVETLVLLDSVCFDAWPVEGVRMLQAAAPDQAASPGFVTDAVRLALDLGTAKRRVDDALVSAFLHPWRADPPSFLRAARAIDGVGLAGREEELAALDMPVLVIWGEEDPFLPAELAERLGDLFPASTVALLPGCSHFVTLDAPETVGPLVFEFVRSRYLGDRHHHAVDTGPIPVFLERPPGDASFGAGPNGRER